MMKSYLIPLALWVGVSVGVSVTPWQQAAAQPSALKPMQDAQRKAEQKAREAKKDDEQTQADDKPQKPASAQPASSP